MHSEGECQSRAASLQSIPLETGAPHPSLLNISLLQLTPGERGGNAAPNESPALGEGAEGQLAAAGFSLKKLGNSLRFFRRRLALRSTLTLNDDEKKPW